VVEPRLTLPSSGLPSAGRLSQTLAVTKRTSKRLYLSHEYSVHLSDHGGGNTPSDPAPYASTTNRRPGRTSIAGSAIEIRNEKHSIIGGLWGGSSYDWLSFNFLLCHRLCEAKASAAS